MEFVASAVQANNTFDGYQIQEYNWTLSPFFNGSFVSVTGTIEQAVAKLDKINPKFGAQLLSHDIIGLGGWNRTFDDYNAIHYECGGRYTACYKQRIFQGVMYLLGLDRAQGTSGRGPHLPKFICSRVSCSYKSAIWLCNDVSDTASR